MNGLDEQTKARIRAEEEYRAQVRGELTPKGPWNTLGKIITGLVLIVVAYALLLSLGWYLMQPG
ncbi:hypothetical protein [Deinococcus radiophilus]|uniref:Uncharacterized protein n=1 Tax=Deinococcus radiophilus TaxID=32062 RepID=A0A3S0ICG8_9DEIO|nr:hypothetical protein [Deinococcus radiophilus]RTR29407.1 hypothetical protein EJ104_03180 [Deinococcus radiophilus]UFA50765.1 hypothetical protein LMT64_02325 [Deinococcus radiophilus]